MVTKRSHIVKQTSSFQRQVCLSMCDLFVTTRVEATFWLLFQPDQFTVIGRRPLVLHAKIQFKEQKCIEILKNPEEYPIFVFFW